MRKNIASVIDAFHAEESYQDKTCRTDGKVIYSYAMPIAARVAGAVLVVDRALAPSATTRSHIAAVSRAFPDAIIARDGIKILVMPARPPASDFVGFPKLSGH